MEPKPFEIGLYTFVENTPDPYTGRLLDPAQRMQDLLERAQLADQVGLDVFAVGEHHREEYLASAPAVILAAIAGRTQRIRLSSAVTVLSSDDPVRVFQQFATLDLLSGAGPRLWRVGALLSSRSRCLATTSTITTSCLKRSSSFC